MKIVTSSVQLQDPQLQQWVLGCDGQPLCCLAPGVFLHTDVVEPWEVLCAAATAAGFSLSIVSAHRSFARQAQIWNAKLNGSRPVLDAQCQLLDLGELEPLDRIKAVMRWSALPGASRHHWGTDVDIYDARAVPADYQVQLLPDEYQGQGPFAPMMAWLKDYLNATEAGFFFPYQVDRGGVAPEPWHLSYQPLASVLQGVWSLDLLQQKLQGSGLIQGAVVLSHLEELYALFIKDSIMSKP